MIVCNHCGAKNQDNKKTCVICGKEITSKEIFIDNNVKTPWYGSTWFIILMLMTFWPVAVYLIWKYKKNWLIADWFIILCLICVFPIGLYLMWKNKKFTNVSRILITIIPIILLIILFIFLFIYADKEMNNVNETQYSNTTIVNDTLVENNDEVKNGWVQEDGYWHYYVKDRLQKNKFVDNDDYYVDENGNMLKNVMKKISGKRYRFDNDGKYVEVEDLELVGGINNTKARYDGYFASYITGTVVNNTDKEYSYVQITFKLYDSSGAKVGSAIANTNDLEPGEKWKFEAMGMTDCATYKLDEITGW